MKERREQERRIEKQIDGEGKKGKEKERMGKRRREGMKESKREGEKE